MRVDTVYGAHGSVILPAGTITVIDEGPVPPHWTDITGMTSVTADDFPEAFANLRLAGRPMVGNAVALPQIQLPAGS
jgi:hypothetical protein